MGLWDGLGEYDSQERRNAICRRQAQMLDEQIAEKHRREALKEKARQRELEEEREEFRPREPPAAHQPWQPYQPYQPPAPAVPQALAAPVGPAQFSVSPPARPFAFNMAQATRAQPAAQQMQQPSFLQQLHQQLLYQPLLQLPSLLAQPPQQQLPQLPALPKRSFWEVPSFQLPPVSSASPPSIAPQRAESVDSFRREAEAARPPSKRPSASESPRRRRSNVVIDIEAEWREWEARHKAQAVRQVSGTVTESSRESPVPMEKEKSDQSGVPSVPSVPSVPRKPPSMWEVPYAPPRVVPIVPPARTLAESYGAGKLMDELQKVKRSWNDEREQLRAESEALKRQALRLQTEQVAIPSTLAGLDALQHPPKLEIFSPLRTGALQQASARRRDLLPVITLQEIKGTLRCLDAGGGSLFLVEPEERPELAGSPTKAGPLPEGATAEKCGGCDNALAVDANFCGSCGMQRKDLRKKDVRSPSGVADPSAVPSGPSVPSPGGSADVPGGSAAAPGEAAAGTKVEKEDAGSRMESTMKSAGKEEDAEMSQFLSSLQYSDSSGRTPSTVTDGRTQRRPSQGFGKVVDLGAELKSTGFDGEKLPAGPVSPGRTQDFLISALLNEETAHPGHQDVSGKPPLAPGGVKARMTPEAVPEEESRSMTPEGQAVKAMS